MDPTTDTPQTHNSYGLVDEENFTRASNTVRVDLVTSRIYTDTFHSNGGGPEGPTEDGTPEDRGIGVGGTSFVPTHDPWRVGPSEGHSDPGPLRPLRHP